MVRCSFFIYIKAHDFSTNTHTKIQKPKLFSLVCVWICTYMGPLKAPCTNFPFLMNCMFLLIHCAPVFHPFIHARLTSLTWMPIILSNTQCLFTFTSAWYSFIWSFHSLHQIFTQWWLSQISCLISYPSPQRTLHPFSLLCFFLSNYRKKTVVSFFCNFLIVM